MDYHTALDDIERRVGIPFAAGSDAEREALARFAAFFSELSQANIERRLDLTYAPDIWFNDTLKTVEGRDALRHYLNESAAAVERCTVAIDDVSSNPRGDYYLRWRMTIAFKRLARGKETCSIGVSHLRFDAGGQVLLQQDYWDSAGGLFEHVPVLGSAIRAIKRRL